MILYMKMAADLEPSILQIFIFILLLKKSIMPKGLTVTVRMFQVGELGDCFLLHFVNDEQESHVLIDCGSFRNSDSSKKRLEKIVGYIRKELKDKKLDLVVGTHQHNDHLSGFVHCAGLFQGIVDQVWLSWLDDPKDTMAKKISSDQQNLVGLMETLNKKLNSLNLSGAHPAVKDILGFYSIDEDSDVPVIPAKGIANLKTLGANPVVYLSPGQQPTLPGMPPELVKVYVLGPPRNQSMLFDKDPKKTETYDPTLALAGQSAGKLISALDNLDTHSDKREEEQFPFNKIFSKRPSHADKDILKIYNNPLQSWRTIESEWLDQADRLALYLDSFTNNSSLVLAFELVQSGKVLLFAADAQTGNWLSWENIRWEKEKADFKTYNLIENTVLYKVGHHASHNATLPKALEAMQHEELVAMIPVDKKDPNITKKNGWKMPAKNLYKRLKEKTGYRVLRMDDGFADECGLTDKKNTWKKLPFKPIIDKKNLFIEYTVQG
jgi:beta-lactamase superfamily II metal-dependent hydrolase